MGNRPPEKVEALIGCCVSTETKFAGQGLETTKKYRTNRFVFEIPEKGKDTKKVQCPCCRTQMDIVTLSKGAIIRTRLLFLAAALMAAALALFLFKTFFPIVKKENTSLFQALVFGITMLISGFSVLSAIYFLIEASKPRFRLYFNIRNQGYTDHKIFRPGSHWDDHIFEDN